MTPDESKGAQLKAHNVLTTKQPENEIPQPEAQEVIVELSENEMARLKAEETFRNDVRSSLPKKYGYGKLVDFLQTPLGGIIVSIIIVGLFSKTTNYISDWHKKNNDREERISRMDKEVEYRIMQLSRQYARDSQYYHNHPGQNADWDNWQTTVRNFKDAPAKSKFQCMYQEFYNLNTFALMMQLSDLVKYNGDPEASNEIQRIALDIANNKYLPLSVASFVEYDSLAKRLNRQVRIKRWKNYFGPGN